MNSHAHINIEINATLKEHFTCQCLASDFDPDSVIEKIMAGMSIIAGKDGMNKALEAFDFLVKTNKD